MKIKGDTFNTIKAGDSLSNSLPPQPNQALQNIGPDWLDCPKINFIKYLPMV